MIDIFVYCTIKPRRQAVVDIVFMSFKSITWRERISQWKQAKRKISYEFGSWKEVPDASDSGSVVDVDLQRSESDNKLRLPFSRKVPMSSSKINPYRVIIFFRLVVSALFLQYRVTHPIQNAYGLWLASVICEVWFSVSWTLDQFPKWRPVNRETYPERLCLRYNEPGKPSELASVDVFIGIVDSLKESPLVIANTILSVFSINYPSERMCCYVSDDGASFLTLEALLETCEFAKKWVPFCKKFSIEPRSPECYFSQKVDYLKYNVYPTFPKERRLIKRQYEDFKVRINNLEVKFRNVPPHGWTMKDGTPWPGNNTGNHPGMIQVIIGSGGPYDDHYRHLPRLVYVSRETRPGFQNNKRAGSINAMVRVSALLTNGAYILNLDSKQYINNSNALLEAMCFMMHRTPTTNKVGYVQFPREFDGIDINDRYANYSSVFCDVDMKGLDGIQGPFCIGTCCIFNRKALYGYDPPSSKSYRRGYWNPSDILDKDMSIQLGTDLRNLENEFPSVFFSLEKTFGQSKILLASVLVSDERFSQSTSPNELLKEAINVISCDYEENTSWGRDIGWLYGSRLSNILTGLEMHGRGWKSVYYTPSHGAFREPAPVNITERLNQIFRSSIGSVEILLSSYCPIWYGYGGELKFKQRVAYINATIAPLTSFPLCVYCALPAILLLTRKFIIPVTSNEASTLLILLFVSIVSNVVLESRWSGVSVQEWWRNQQFWVISGVSSHLFGVFKGVIMGSRNGGEHYIFKVSSLLLLPTTFIFINMWAMFAGLFSAASSGYWSWVLLFSRLFFAFCVIAHLHPFLKSLFGRKRDIPTVVVVWSLLLASMFALFWVRVSPFTTTFRGPDPKLCGNQC
ncbi:cellulose synthase (UDP-forming) [Ranunculus cassubicifolius]